MTMISIKILNWEKYNPRKDITNGTWVRLNVDVFTSQTLFELTLEEKATWLFILTQCAKRQGSVDLKVGWCKTMGFPESVVKSTVQKLEIIGCVTATYADVRARTQTAPTNVRTYERNERTILSEIETKAGKEAVAIATELETLYQKYPRKVGRLEGIAKARRQIKTPEECEQLSHALDKFVEYCKRTGREARYIPIFSTWMNSWRDWLEPDAGTEDGFDKPKYRPLSEVIAEAELEAANATA